MTEAAQVGRPTKYNTLTGNTWGVFKPRFSTLSPTRRHAVSVSNAMAVGDSTVENLCCKSLVLTGVSIAWLLGGQVSTVQADSVQISSVLRCGPLSKSNNSKKDRAFAYNFPFNNSDGKLTGERLTRSRPGKEVYSGSISPKGFIRITGRGSYYKAKGSWSSEFSGQVSDADVTTLEGHLRAGAGRSKRDCELSFIELGADLRSKLGLAPTHSDTATQKLQAEIKHLKELQADTTKQLKAAQQHAEKAQSSTTKNVTQTQTNLRELEQKQAALTKQLQDTQQQVRREQSGTANNVAQTRASVQQLEQKQAALAKQLQDVQQQIEKERSGAANNVAQTKANIGRLEQKQATLSKQVQEGQKRLTATKTTVEGIGKFLNGIVLPAWEDPKDWMMRVSAVPVQQQQFCRVVDRFYDDLERVYLANNEIKKNTLFRDRRRDMATLLPQGNFQNWVVQIKEVTQAPDGSAAVMLQPPCRAMLGSDACQKNGSKIRATIPSNSPLYRELSRVSEGDFVIVSGKILYAETESPGQPLPTYALYQPGSHCSAVKGTKQEDVFVTEVSYLVQLR